MQADRRQRLKQLFEHGLQLEASARSLWLDRLDAADADLQAELRELLAADAQVQQQTVPPLAPMMVQWLQSAPGSAATGQRIGPFELCEVLGRGGMGVVFRAERRDGAVEQQVAIKLVRAELLDEPTRRRFELERRTLAGLDHPHIARLIDAAELPDGTPYFVMEYVAGQAITSYCQAQVHDLRARVSLFRSVCSAVAHAHRNLIVHRDIKPANVLVTRQGVPKLLDFGIAKPLCAPDTAQTSAEARYFSPQYASPEQLSGQPVSVGCDIHALGLLLHELLTDRTAFDLTGQTPAQIERAILAVPVALTSQVATSAGPKAPFAPRALRGDLDGIVQRCLRKSASERYGTVEQLDADLANYLEGRPVLARGGHRWYRLRKFIGRNRWAVAGTTALAVSLIGGVIAFAWQASIAERRARELAEVASFQAQMLRQVDPAVSGVRLQQALRAQLHTAMQSSGMADAEAQEQVFAGLLRRINATDVAREFMDFTILGPATDAVNKRFADQPVLAASLRQSIADQYREFGMFKQALPLMKQAHEQFVKHLGADDLLALESALYLGQVLHESGEVPGALALLERSHEALQTRLGGLAGLTLTATNDLGLVLSRTDALDRSRSLLRAAVEGRIATLGPEDPLTLNAMDNYAHVLVQLGQVAGAEPWYRRALEGRRKVLGAEHPQTVSSVNNYSYLLFKSGRLSEAEPYAREVLRLRLSLLGADHPATLLAANNLGGNLEGQGKFAEAEPLRRQSLARARLVLGEMHPRTITYVEGLASLLDFTQPGGAAEPYWLEAYDKRLQTAGPRNPETLLMQFNLGIHYQSRGLLKRAEPYLVETERMRAIVLGAEHADTLRAKVRLAHLRIDQSRFDEAKQLLVPIEGSVRKVFAAASRRILARFLLRLGQAHAGLGEWAAAEHVLTESCTIFEDLPVDVYASETGDCLRAGLAVLEQRQSSQPKPDLSMQLASWRERLDRAPAAPSR